MEVFSRSDRDKNEEETLRRADMENLPMYTGMRRGIIHTEENGEPKEVDINSLGAVERKNLLGRLLEGSEEGNEKLLLKIRERMDRVGISLATIEVRFEQLSVLAEAYVGSRAVPTTYNFIANLLEGFLSYLHVLPSRKKTFTILQDLSGIIKPGRMTLLLGPPSSGKTTLLSTLSGNLDPDVKVFGKTTYNGHTTDEFVPQRSSAYIGQHDLHLGELTVRETLAFSARCQGVGANYEMLAELLRREKEANIRPDPDLDIFMKLASTEGLEASIMTDYIIKILGLDDCADVVVGNEMIRGISGGQIKRLTIGEMMVGPARAFFMDEISNGLDSSTTFQIVNSIKNFIHILQGTAVISLLQPAPETYDLFDDIILLSDGRIVYQGPRENVLEFFQGMGFRRPKRIVVADFLQEVTSKKDQEQYWIHTDKPYRYVSIEEFCEAFRSFHVGQKLGDELAIPFDRAKSHPAALTTNKYGVGKMNIFKACISREFLLIRRNALVHVSRTMQLVFMGIMATTVFLRTEMPKNTLMDGETFMGALLYILLAIMFIGYSDMIITVLNLPVFYKQRDLRFFPAWAHSLPVWILKVPITFIDVAIWVLVTYYPIGFDSDPIRFLKHFFLLSCMNQAGTSLFRWMAALGRDMIIANTFGTSSLLLFVLNGFFLPRDKVKSWWIWAYWLSPIMYGQNAIAVNEFLGKSWAEVLPGFNEPIGVLVLKSRAIFQEAQWYWIGVGALIGYIFVLNFLNTLALTYLNPIGRSHNVVSEEAAAEINTSITRKHVEFSSIEPGNDVRQTVPSMSMSSVMAGNVEAYPNRKRGLVLPFEPLWITFQDIRYAVDMPQEMKAHGAVGDRLEILKDITGAFKPGILTALMGVTGAGKTSLMDVLSGRKTTGYTNGTITVSGYPKKQETFARIAGYCEQYDIHSPHVTVYESLQYSAWLRLPKEVDNETREMFIEEVMEVVELTELRGGIVGLPGVNGLSTAQRKRLTIAVELVANPSIIFMDEPTSGLDARAAAIVMRTVRNTVDTGRTVVCTIHQPSIDIFDAFDELLLLKRGGEEIYVGPLGLHSSEIIQFFERIDGVPKIIDGYNPATWMMEVTSTAQEVTLGIDFAKTYKNSELYRRNKALTTELSEPVPGSKDIHFPTRYSQSLFTQCMACLWKQHHLYSHNPTYVAVRMLFTGFVALLFGTILWDLGSRRAKQSDIITDVGTTFAAILFLGVQNVGSVQPVAAVERTVFYRERAAGMYSAFPYAFAQVAIELPHTLIQTLIHCGITYAMLGYEWTGAKLFWYLFLFYFTFLYFTLLGMMTVAVTPNQSIAYLAAASFYGMWILFSGFFVPVTRIPVWWKWYYYTCPLAWSVNGIVASQFGDMQDELETNQTVEEFVRSYLGYKLEFVGYVAVIVFGTCLLFGFIFAFSVKFQELKNVYPDGAISNHQKGEFSLKDGSVTQSKSEKCPDVEKGASTMYEEDEMSDQDQGPGTSTKRFSRELLLNLPRLASLPQFLFSVPEDYVNKAGQW